MLSNQNLPSADDIVMALKPTSACCAALGKGDTKPELFEFTEQAVGSRRQRLWELSSTAHCPVIGVCIAIDSLRRVATKLLVGAAELDDYQLHCEAIAHSKRRSPLAEALQNALDQRYATAVRKTAALKTTEALATWWHQSSVVAQPGSDLPGALWATLTHPRCDSLLAHKVLGEVHMIQHQVGVVQRTDHAQLSQSTQQLAALKTELQALQQRLQKQASEHARNGAQQQAQMMKLRCDLVTRDTLIAALRDDLEALHASTPQLKSRLDLTREGDRQKNRIVDLERALTQAKDQVQIQVSATEEALAAFALQRAASARDATQAAQFGENVSSAKSDEPAATLSDRAVLCVGGRPASVPLYRHIVEKTGGRFLHHDGGEQESQTRLDATLAAADLVICQTGCISHGAYWRVKDHCKRHGKPCVFVENPGSASLRRALAEFQPVVLS
jgi:Uncharacterized protein conserved in bacteria (DUF2325)